MALIFLHSLILKFSHFIFLQLDLTTFITKSGCECLNESDDHPLAGCLTSNPGYLESDCDEQVVLRQQIQIRLSFYNFYLFLFRSSSFRSLLIKP